MQMGLRVWCDTPGCPGSACPRYENFITQWVWERSPTHVSNNIVVATAHDCLQTWPCLHIIQVKKVIWLAHNRYIISILHIYCHFMSCTRILNCEQTCWRKTVGLNKHVSKQTVANKQSLAQWNVHTSNKILNAKLIL